MKVMRLHAAQVRQTGLQSGSGVPAAKRRHISEPEPEIQLCQFGPVAPVAPIGPGVQLVQVTRQSLHFSEPRSWESFGASPVRDTEASEFLEVSQRVLGV